MPLISPSIELRQRDVRPFGKGAGTLTQHEGNTWIDRALSIGACEPKQILGLFGKADDKSWPEPMRKKNRHSDHWEDYWSAVSQ